MNNQNGLKFLAGILAVLVLVLFYIIYRNVKGLEFALTDSQAGSVASRPSSTPMPEPDKYPGSCSKKTSGGSRTSTTSSAPIRVGNGVAPDVTAVLTNLGNAFDGESTTSRKWYKNPLGMFAFDNKVFMAHGDFRKTLAATGAPIVSYDPSTNAFTKVYNTTSNMLVNAFRVIGGTLSIPSYYPISQASHY